MLSETNGKVVMT